MFAAVLQERVISNYCNPNQYIVKTNGKFLVKDYTCIIIGKFKEKYIYFLALEASEFFHKFKL